MYTRGNQRIFYSSNSKDIVEVTIDVVPPNLNIVKNLQMIYLEDNIYYIDVCFTQFGSHVFTIYENGKRQHRDILRVSGGKFLIYPEGYKI